ncbi:MAG: peptidoglycan-associated lipoprotein Pal [Deltaproteobacteria bacterium]
MTVTAVGLTGCAKKTVKTEAPCTTPVTSSSDSLAGATEEDKGIRYAENISEGRTSGPMLPVYFDFDQYTIRSDMVSRIEGNATFLKDNPEVRVEIQGNCDERGTNEYNLALGEKRAMSAKKYLMNLGVRGDRIDTVSLGEEAPLDPGHDEAAWKVNRRDDFVIISR